MRRSCCRRSAARPTALIHLTAIAERTPHRIDLDAIRPARPRGAGAGRPEAVRRALHGAFPSRRRRAEAAAAAGRPDRSRCPHDRRRARCASVVAAAEEVPGQTVIRPRGDPIKSGRRDGGAARQPGAARGGHQAFGAATPALLQHTGRAVVFDSVADMTPPHRRPGARRHAPTTCWCCAMPGRRARRACRRPATCRSRRSWRARA